MRHAASENRTEPIPGKRLLMAAIVLTTAVSTLLTAGKAAAAEGWELSALLADGTFAQTPWYITVDGEKAALVASRDEAEEAVKEAVAAYKAEQVDEGAEILDLEIVEEISAQRMEAGSGGESPDVMTVKQAADELMTGNGGDGYLTIVTMEEEREEESIDFTEEYRPDPSLFMGETRVESEGRDGTKEVVKQVVRENGDAVEERIVEEEILEEPEQQVVLTGVARPAGSTGRSYDDGLSISYDENAVYGKLERPVSGGRVSSEFGSRWGKLHRGLDIATSHGSEIRAADAGTVYFADWADSYGNIVKLDHGNGMQTYYAHCSKLLVGSGQQVERGEVIALVGSTGNSTGPHVHFEVIINGTCVNPLTFLEE